MGQHGVVRIAMVLQALFYLLALSLCLCVSVYCRVRENEHQATVELRT